MTRSLIAALAGLALVAGLAGCSNTPDREAVVDRFLVELTSDLPDGADEQFAEAAETLADDALDGMCGSDAYLSGIGEQQPTLGAWAATCSMMFADDMTDEQREHFEQLVADEAIDGVTGG